MVIADFVFSLVIALILSGGFVLLTRSRRKRQGFWWLFLLIWIATWAGGIWLRPFGPSIGGVRWLQFLIAGLIFVGLIALFLPTRPPYGRIETLEKLTEMRQGKALEQATYVTLGVLFWVILAILIIAIIVRYLPAVKG
jgi:hypothetical protein